ncbi:putative transcription regulator [Pseudoalteromonas ulvae UL12]|uniref:Cys-tRNA(Pro)/Cys-tRNA(Cys) deacylase n=1 Tax=Pseudoalteromonas ulvae TaxID=107327 RepID=A0A244CT01_PSEDV|nr:Cys-tRNA(Pro) deacylase [Pseudoalteromonas ulvae]MBE0366015.1 putative transcription regulator [Pseudoalteromonas ulvae UL12]OUL58723.1 aminoacyl-tRNA deacylase [Pseudoalteromonas ulvae]
MTPAIKQLDSAKCAYQTHQYEHDSHHSSYGLEAAEKLKLAANQVFKTLVVELDSHQLAVAILPVCQQLNLKRMAKACGVKKAAMASPDKVQRTTGYVLGGVSPLGQKKRLQTVIDESAQHFAHIYISGGRRGLEISLSASDLSQLTSASFAQLTE